MSRVTDPHTYKRRRVLAAGLAMSAVGGFAALRYGKRLAARAGQVQGYPSEAPRLSGNDGINYSDGSGGQSIPTSWRTNRTHGTNKAATYTPTAGQLCSR